jgi:NAD(P)-dependent dehydrogenase (short-subunit alcohol dehydrogenase family)
MKIDLSSFESIRSFAKEFLNQETRLDVLIHNAGYGGYAQKVSSDGIEMTYAINHYGPFLLTHLLIDILKKSVPSRIVIVASDVYRYARVKVQNLNPVNSRLVWYLYYSSKGLNIMFTQELARRLEGSNVTVNCLHPGYVHTPLWHRLPKIMWIPTNFLYKTFGKTPVEGARASVYLTCSEDVNEVSGKYFKDCKMTMLKSHITDIEKCKILWQESIKLTKLQPDDPQI